MPIQMKWIKVCLPLAALAIVAFCYWPSPPSYIPAKLWGVWRTDDVSYADRYLDISEAIFTIGQGREHLEVLFLDRVEMAPMASGERYTLYYRPSGSASGPSQSFRFDFFMSAAGPRIQLNNPPQVRWYRETETAGDTPDEGTAAR